MTCLTLLPSFDWSSHTTPIISVCNYTTRYYKPIHKCILLPPLIPYMSLKLLHLIAFPSFVAPFYLTLFSPNLYSCLFSTFIPVNKKPHTSLSHSVIYPSPFLNSRHSLSHLSFYSASLCCLSSLNSILAFCYLCLPIIYWLVRSSSHLFSLFHVPEP